MPVPNVYDLPDGKVGGDFVFASEINALSNALNLLGVRLAEAQGEGAFRHTDFNGIIVPGALQLQISPGDAFVGAAGGRKLVYQEDPYLATASDGIVASATNYFYLLRDGTWEVVQDTLDAPANSHLMISAPFDTNDATSVNNAPSGRNNLFPVTIDLDAYALSIAAGTQKRVRCVIGKGSFADPSKYFVNVVHAHAKDKVAIVVDPTRTANEFWVHVQNVTGSGLATVNLDFQVYGPGWLPAASPVAEAFTAFTFTL